MGSTIISLNPRLATVSRQNEKKSTKEYVAQIFPDTSRLRKLINRAMKKPVRDWVMETQKVHDDSAVAGFAHALPFQADTFDLILDKDAVSKYATPQDHDFVDKSTHEEKELFKESLREMIRVLKPGGKIRISDVFGYGSKEDWKQNILYELGLDYKVLWEDMTNSYVYPNLWGDKRAIGVEIIKH